MAPLVTDLRGLVDGYPTVIRRLIDRLIDETHPVVQLWHLCSIVETAFKIAVAVHGPVSDPRIARRLVSDPGLGAWWAAAQALRVTSEPMRRWIYPDTPAGGLRDPLAGLGSLRNALAHSPVLERESADRYLVHHTSCAAEVLPAFGWLSDEYVEEDPLTLSPPGVGHIFCKAGPEPRDLFPILSMDRLAGYQIPRTVHYVYLRVEGRPPAVIASTVGGIEPQVAIPDALETLRDRVGAPRDDSRELPFEVLEEAARVQGRQDALDLLIERLDEPGRSRRPLWIDGDRGIGKSGLLAKAACALVHVSGYEVHWCRFSASDTASPLDALKAQLGYREDIAVSRWLRELRIGSARPVVFVDGLDEIEPPRQAHVLAFVSDLCGRPKSPLRWVISSRHVDGLTHVDGERLFDRGLPPLDEDGIHAVLMRLPEPVRDEVVRAEPFSGEGTRGDWIAEIWRASKGSPLYVHLLMEDLKTGVIAPRCRVPASLGDYFTRLLGRHGVDDTAAGMPVLLATAVAVQAALDADVLATIMSPVAPDAPFVRDGITRLQQLGLLIESADGLRPFHPGLEQHVANSAQLAQSWAKARGLVADAMTGRYSRCVKASVRRRLASVAVRALAAAAPDELPRVVTNPVWMMDRLGCDAAGLGEALVDVSAVEPYSVAEVRPFRQFLERVQPALILAGRCESGMAAEALSSLACSQPPGTPVRDARRWKRRSRRLLASVRPIELAPADGLRGSLRRVEVEAVVPTAWAGTESGFVVGVDDGRIMVIDLDGAVRWVFDEKVDEWVVALAQNADGDIAALWSDGVVRAIEADPGEQWARRLDALSAGVSGVTVSMGWRGQDVAIAAADDRLLRFVTVNRFGSDVVWTNPIADGMRVTSMAIDPAGVVFAAHADGTVRAWSGSGARVIDDRGEDALPESVAIDMAGDTVVAGWADGLVSVSGIVGDGAYQRQPPLVVHSDAARTVSIAGDSRLSVVCFLDRIVACRASDTDVRFLEAPVAAVPVGDTILLVREVADQQMAPMMLWKPFAGHDNVVGVALDGDRALSVGSEGSLRQWEVGSGQVVRTVALPGHGAALDWPARVVWTESDEVRDDGTVARAAWRLDGALNIAPVLDGRDPTGTPSSAEGDRLSLFAESGACQVVVRNDEDLLACVVELRPGVGRRLRRWFHPNPVNAVAVRDDGLVVIGDEEGQVVFLREARG